MLGRHMEAELREQPLLLKQNWPFYDDQLRAFLRGKSFDVIVLAARGTSDNAAMYARYLLEIYLSIPVILSAPSVLTRYHKRVTYPPALVVGISQSGAAPDVAEVLADAREQGHTTIAITNTPGSKITETADFTLQLDLGTEKAVAATKTYSASLLAMYALVRGLGGSLECPLLPDEQWVEECRFAAERDADAVIGADTVFTLARGLRFCSAEESALKLMECALVPCLSYSLADFQHGPRALASDCSVAIVYGEKDATDFQRITAPECPGVAEAVQPIWDAVYAQWLALAAARRMKLDPDHPESLKKVTKTL